MITSEKLVSSENYLSWFAFVELWFMGQGYEDHLVTQEANILEIASLKEEFLTVMPLTTDVGDQRTQIDKFFMVLTLIGPRPNLETIRDQILGSSSVPSLDDVFARLLRGGNRGRGQRPHCTYCNKLGHTRDRCYQLHGRPPRIAHWPSHLILSRLNLPVISEYDDYLCYQATKLASVAQTGNASACLTHTSSLGPWILDSDASDHIFGNKDLFSSITTTSALPNVTLANGSQTMAKDFGLAHPLLSLPLHFVLYAPECPFNLISISKITRTFNCSITFSDKFVTLQGRSMGKTIGIGFAWATLVYLSSRKWSIVFHLCRRLHGYRCYSSEIHCYFLSADVTFFEDSPFFSTSESLPVSEVLPLPIISPPDAVPFCPLQVYHRCHRVVVPPSLAEVPVDSLPIPSASLAPALPPSADLLIAIRKVSCRWVYTIKVGPDSQVDCLKARLVAKGYTQVYGSDYGDTFSSVAKIASVRLLLSMAAMRSWPLYQLDIKNVFLHGDLAEEVYMEQPPGFVAQGESGLVCRLHRSLYGLKQSPRAWFSRFSFVVQEFGMFRSSDQNGIQKLKQHLFTHFQTKDLGKLKYFLGIEIAQSSFGVVLSQRKYALDILEETGMLDCKPVDTLMDPNVKLIPGQGEPLGDLGRYRQLVGKLNYLTITRPDISFPVSVVSQFLQSPCDSHWDVVIRILRYIKSTPGQDRRSTSEYCVFIGGNLISWKSKKQDVVARSSVEAEYRAMALATCELIWLKHLLRELRFGKDEQMKLICDNQAALHIASNPVFHERTKHIKVDCHFIREKIASGCVTTSFVNSNDQLADIFTKSLRGPRIKYICNKLDAYNIYAPA
ncbi:Retrovirus-related Pol polyprotein from transposon RE2 [Vitis vinifera]|uniref:Retrovirus-related Pol polyprotein from transposon RE2 n=2 Tax=Vitis vinifera TaxID=29760 RepID=A0A438F1I9_VITVI|nr:Retrovirus-related Pol polyprotein from transposon RE2 [Vitis vinifera]